MMENPNDLQNNQGSSDSGSKAISLEIIFIEFKHAIHIVKANLPLAAFVALLLILIEAFSGLTGFKIGSEGSAGSGLSLSILAFILAIVAYIIPYAFAFVMARYDVSGRSVGDNFSILLNIFTSKFIPLLILGILKGIMILLGLVLLIVPGIIVALMLMFAEFVVISKHKGAIAAISESMELTKGLKTNAFFAAVILILILLVPYMIGFALFGKFSENIYNGVAYDRMHQTSQMQSLLRIEEQALTPEQQKLLDNIQKNVQQLQNNKTNEVAPVQVPEQRAVSAVENYKLNFKDHQKEIYKPTMTQYIGSFVIDFIMKLISLSATITIGLIYFRKTVMN